MTEHEEFLEEKKKIDEFIKRGYRIREVIENLDGAFVEFEKGKDDVETLHVLTTYARKYFSNLIIKQNKEIS